MELADSKKESKKRRKMLETQQRMLMAQNSNYHTVSNQSATFLYTLPPLSFSVLFAPMRF